MGSYFTLLNALAEDGRLDEAEELWTKLFSENLESMPRVFYDKMISIYYRRDMHEKMFEVILCLIFFLKTICHFKSVFIFIWMEKSKLQYINSIEHDNVAFSSLSMFLIRIWLHLIRSIGIFTDALSLCLYIFFTTQIWIQFMLTEDWKTDIHLNPVELRRLEGHIFFVEILNVSSISLIFILCVHVEAILAYEMTVLLDLTACIELKWLSLGVCMVRLVQFWVLKSN